MKRICIWSILIISVILVLGCEKTGYIVIINTNHIKYNDLQQIGRMLEERGFKVVVWEKKKDMSKEPDKVYSVFEKQLSSKPYYFVDVYFDYIKDVTNNIACNLRIDVHNIYKGMTVTKLKDEIDKIGDLVYQEVVDKVEKENVMIERKEKHQRVIFF
jgi:hypothetical protein